MNFGVLFEAFEQLIKEDEQIFQDFNRNFKTEYDKINDD